MFSFSKRKKTVDAATKVRKLIDLTCPVVIQCEEGRSSRRYSRSLPVMLLDWLPGESPSLQHCGMGFTTDISDRGFCVLTKFVPKLHDNILGLCTVNNAVKEYWFFHVSFKTYRREPQNYIRIGYSIVECLNDDYGSIVNPLIPKLEEFLSIPDVETEPATV